ncbi:hypothetical protein OS175_04150 [Marinicella sp. S1101]|uniref:hypothetical protein n=1 Tax=Marinicella marina TaxID=2996016 RepID=UPI0022609810|nr:hypothetical protein [Marinicella marina]MCX7553059.1 hypothetical protein [Marinicella marina]MDJ1139581.1 hypothetical protein [Marinicella marina]
MKLLLLSLVLFTSTSIEHTTTKAPINFGHSPIAHNHCFDAVMPLNNRKIQTTDSMPNDQPPINHEMELLNACLSSLVALTPHFIIGYF